MQSPPPLPLCLGYDKNSDKRQTLRYKLITRKDDIRVYNCIGLDHSLKANVNCSIMRYPELEAATVEWSNKLKL